MLDYVRHIKKTKNLKCVEKKLAKGACLGEKNMIDVHLHVGDFVSRVSSADSAEYLPKLRKTHSNQNQHS